MQQYATIRIPLPTVCKDEWRQSVENMVQNYAISLTSGLDADVKPLTAFRGFCSGGDLKDLRRRAMRAKFGISAMFCKKYGRKG